MWGRSSNVKYAVRWYLHLWWVLGSVTQAEYACLTSAELFAFSSNCGGNALGAYAYGIYTAVFGREDLPKRVEGLPQGQRDPGEADW
jgi:hypothetical protein